MDLLPRFAERAGQFHLDLRVHVLDTLLDDELPFCGFPVEFPQFGKDALHLRGGNQPDLPEHGHVRKRPQDVAGGEKEVQFAVFSDRKALDPFVERIAFVPEFHIFPSCSPSSRRT